ncbi:MAG: biotin/lipoyl-containing protein [Oscillospiraceae bacterium]
MTYIVEISGTRYEVEVEKGKAEILSTAAVAAAPAPVVAAPAAAPAPVAAPAAAPTAVSGTPVNAPLPGTILDIKVQPGMAVKSGQLLLLIEAMKMENEILAPQDGTVGDIVVSKGSSVNTDDLLLTLR